MLNTLTLLALASSALAQSGMKSSASATASATVSGAEVITMMWDNMPTSAATTGSKSMEEMSGMSMDSTVKMSSGEKKTGMSLSGAAAAAKATGTAMEGMNMSGSAGKSDSVMGAGWIIVSLGAGVGFLAGML